MKTIFFLALLSGLLNMMTSSSAMAADRFYVVVASFSKASASSAFAASIRALFPNVSEVYDEHLKLHHVTAFETGRYKDARRHRDQVRQSMGFYDAWIYRKFDASYTSPGTQESNSPVALELYTGEMVLLSSTSNAHLTISKSARATKEGSSPTTSFTFVASTANGIEIPGKVILVDQRGDVMASLKTGEHVTLRSQGEGQTFRLMFSADGYAPAALHVDIAMLGRIPDVYQSGDGVWQVDFLATKLHQNEVHLLYHELFHPQSAILQERSRQLLEAWVSMLRSNRRLRAAIDTHCQPGGKRKIRLPGSDDLFDITAGVDQTGSDKRLTKERADVLLSYLTSNGVDSKRVTALGWGSIHPLVSSAAPNAEINERVGVTLMMLD